MPRLFLIDGSSQMYRAYHAIRGLTGPDGRSTNAVYGFTTMLRKLIADHRPEFIAASFDLAGPTFRDELAPDYKANRAPMPADLAEQVPLVREACEALGVPILAMEGFEADDVIGTLARQARAAGFDVAIVTGDKDFYQLVGDGVRVYNPRDEGTWYDPEGVVKKFGVRPDQVVDVLALMGDSIDNIKGVPGIGEKGARDLVAFHGTLDALLAAAASVPQKRYREALLAHADSARASRELARIRTDVPVQFEPDAVRYRGPSRERCFALFASLGFRSLVSEFAPTASTAARDYAVATSIDDVEALAQSLRAAGRIGVAPIAGGGSAVRARIVGWAFSAGAGTGRYVPLAHTGLADTPNLPAREVWAWLGPVLADPAVAKVVHDLKFALIAAATAGLAIASDDLDTMVASYLLDATRSSHDLAGLALERANYRALTEEDVRGSGAKAVPLEAVPAQSLAAYAAERADLPLTLAPDLAGDLERERLMSVYRDLEQPLVPVLADLERTGVKVDAAALTTLGARMQSELEELTARIHALAGGEFNVNSPKQLSEVLFGRLNLQPTKKKTGKTRAVSTAMDVLEELALVHELPGLVLKWRSIQKLKGTYVDTLPALIDPATGRVHATFNQAVAATGRLSTSDPNLQNIPVRTALGREIRAAFVAEPGHQLISADYSQIELRVLAHLSGDAALADAFKRGIDIHDETATRVFGTASGLDRHELRRRAKIINYAILYGKVAATLAKDIDVPRQAAQAFIDAYFAGYPGVRAFIDRTLEDARTTGVVRTMSGRRRLVPELASRNGQVRAAAERETINLPIQGTAADILKKAMIDVHAALVAHNAGRRRPSRMILTVHDELLFEAPDADAAEVAELVRGLMERAMPLTVPVTVDVGIGRNWNEAKP